MLKGYIYRSMCGIAGITGTAAGTGRAGDELVLRLLGLRGRDARNVKHHAVGSLYHTRLSIIDTSDASSQPYVYPGTNDALVYNGEIFNYRELGKSLGSLRTSGDVEVLYRLLREKGEAALPLLNGFFAFGYIADDNSVLLARDRFGEKPLYYAVQNGQLLFASELKCLLALTGPQEINGAQLYTYLRLNYCAGEQTIFKNIFRLLPGQLVSFRNGELQKRQWYSVSPGDPSGDLFALLDNAVDLRLRADVAVGTFLSGGLDSSIITALAARHKRDLPAFTIGFRDHRYLDETAHAVKLAKHTGIQHHVFSLGEDDFLSGLPAFLAGMDEPFADSSAFNVFMLSKLASPHIKVALSGDGADELFKGYRKHRAMLLAEQPIISALGKAATKIAGMLPSSRAGAFGDGVRKIEKFGRFCGLPRRERVKFLASVAGDAETNSLLSPELSGEYFSILFENNALLPNFPEEERFDVAHVLSDDMLVKGDRFGLRHGLEIRNPFLDVHVAEHALRLPRGRKITLNGQKLVLRKTFGHLLPGEILNRRKKGFELPIEKWLKGALWQQVNNEWLNEETISAQSIFNVAAVRDLKLQLFSGRPSDAPARIWALIVFMQFINNFGAGIKYAGDRPVIS